MVQEKVKYKSVGCSTLQLGERIIVELGQYTKAYTKEVAAGMSKSGKPYGAFKICSLKATYKGMPDWFISLTPTTAEKVEAFKPGQFITIEKTFVNNRLGFAVAEHNPSKDFVAAWRIKSALYSQATPDQLTENDIVPKELKPEDLTDTLTDLKLDFDDLVKVKEALDTLR